MFEKASRMKLRFYFKGLCSIEDLWDLSLEDLDTLFKAYNINIKNQEEESLLETKTDSNETLNLQISIIRYIVKVKIEEDKINKEKKENIARKKRLLMIIADKQDTVERDMPIEELNKLLNEIEGKLV